MTKILEDSNVRSFDISNNKKVTCDRYNMLHTTDDVDVRSPLASRRRYIPSSKTPSPLLSRKSFSPSPLATDIFVDENTSSASIDGDTLLSAGDLLYARLSPVVGLKRRVDNLPFQSHGSDSRRSSGSSSIPEVIEECDSDEELNDDETEDSISNDYIRCINCSRSKSTDSIDQMKNTIPSIINYCYKCRHLNHNPHLPAFYEGRRSSWTAGVNYLNSPRNSRKSSLASSASELPIICEPSFDDETNDTIELQMSVKQEVDKLTKLNNSKNQTNNNLPVRNINDINKAIPNRENRKQKLLSLRETKI